MSADPEEAAVVLVELNLVEQRYRAVLEVLNDGVSVTDVARRFGVSRQTVHVWLRRYATDGLGGLADRNSKPLSCPHQMAPELEARIVEMRRAHPGWGPRTILFWLDRAGVSPLPGRSTSLGALSRLALEHGDDLLGVLADRRDVPEHPLRRGVVRHRLELLLPIDLPELGRDALQDQPDSGDHRAHDQNLLHQDERPRPVHGPEGPLVPARRSRTRDCRRPRGVPDASVGSVGSQETPAARRSSLVTG